jgi:3-phosphoshikimate 1-carboxyvinyltransferase
MTSVDELVVVGPRPLRGDLRVPGDKGISHRALLAASLAEGTSTITNLGPGDDVARTDAALRALGVTTARAPGQISVDGNGIESLRAPAGDIDCGNSGTTMRMLAGLLAGRPFRSVLTGDRSLVERPMLRVVAPLRALGAHIDGRDGANHAPLHIDGTDLRGARVELEVASGQVKTALVLAGLQASGTTEIVEPAPSRDHTERLFAALGAPIDRVDERTTRVRAGAPAAFSATIPGDPSSAAFFVVAATITPGSELRLVDVLLNPGRIAFVDVLRAMGAKISVRVREERLGEPIGNIEVTAAPLRGTTFRSTEGIVDEIPVLAVAASFADGVTEIQNVAELRVKESNRVATIEHELTNLGVGVESRADAVVIRGGHPRPAALTSHGDHRIAMAAAVAANAIDGESRVDGWSSVAVSYPGFADDLELLTGSR